MGGINHRQGRLMHLPPVLYHGTAKYLIDRAIKYRDTIPRLSITPDPDIAARYASYKIADKLMSGYLFLINGYSRRFHINLDEPEETGPSEIQRLKSGKVNNSLVLFDRDTLLRIPAHNPGVEMLDDESTGGGMNGLQLSSHDRFDYPLDALICTFDYQSGEKKVKAVPIEFRLFNFHLWQENFIIDPPDNHIIYKITRSALPELAFVMFARKLFTGLDT